MRGEREEWGGVGISCVCNLNVRGERERWIIVGERGYRGGCHYGDRCSAQRSNSTRLSKPVPTHKHTHTHTFTQLWRADRPLSPLGPRYTSLHSNSTLWMQSTPTLKTYVKIVWFMCSVLHSSLHHVIVICCENKCNTKTREGLESAGLFSHVMGQVIDVMKSHIW